MGMGMGMGMAAPMGPAPAGPPMGGPPMGMPMAPPDPTEMMLEQIMLLFQKWGSGEMQIAGEKASLAETLQMLLGAVPPNAAQVMAEPGAGVGMVGPPMEDVPPASAPAGF
jgi:hypothetical protein